MKLAMRLAAKPKLADNDRDPREGESAEIIDLASRTAYPTVTQRKGKSDALGLAAGVAVVALLGMATLWGMNSARYNGERPRAPAVPLQPPGTVPVAAGPMGDGKGNTASDFASRIGGVGGGPAQAHADIDPKTTVTQGTIIPAILETAINTDVPGYVRAIVNQDVRSFDGSRVLVPRSSRLIGQYQSGLQAGQRRAYVIWTRLIRPDGVSVALASPAAAFDGSGGLPGKVDTHFFQRFGSAILLSVIGGLSAGASGGSSIILGGGQTAAGTALEQNGNIGPTIRVRPGEPIRVFTARDLDFSQAPQL